MTVLHSPNQNQLLAALPASEFARLSSYLELVPMPLGESYYESNGKLQHVYFPTTSIVSLRYMMENGCTAEIAGVGNEGMLGISVFMGDKALPKQAIVRTVGYGYRMKARLLLEEFNRAGTFQQLLIRYTKSLIIQASQVVVCNRYHSVEQKICRWFMHNYEYIAANDLSVTQEILSSVLGIRRNILTEALRKLREAGLINYYGGHITMLNIQNVEDHACECFRMIESSVNRMPKQSDSNPMHENVIALSMASSDGISRISYRVL